MAKPSTDLHDVPKELERKIIPFVSVRDCDKYMTFLTKVFGAEEAYPASKDPTGKVCAVLCIFLGVSCLKVFFILQQYYYSS